MAAALPAQRTLAMASKSIALLPAKILAEAGAAPGPLANQLPASELKQQAPQQEAPQLVSEKALGC